MTIAAEEWTPAAGPGDSTSVTIAGGSAVMPKPPPERRVHVLVSLDTPGPDIDTLGDARWAIEYLDSLLVAPHIQSIQISFEAESE